MKVFFVRHGKDDDSYRGGWSSMDLIPEGIKQAKQLGKYLKENNQYYAITQIVSSDIPRAMTTANIIASELDLPVQAEFQIREANNGDLAGMPNHIANEKYPGLFFSSLEMDEAYPNGESPNDFYRRIRAWFYAFCSNCSNIPGNVLVVTHGGVINVIYHLVKGMEWSNKGPVFKAGNCSIHIFNMDTMEMEEER